MSKSFICYPMGTGLLADLSGDKFPSQMRGWNEGILNLPSLGTHYGFVWRGQPVITTKAGQVRSHQE